MPKTSKDVKKLAKDAKVEIIDLRFVDLPGVWQHFSLPARELSDDMFTDGLGFDGSSIRGYQQIQESDMLLIPDPETAFVDPVLQVPTLSMICNVLDPVTRERYTRDPRHIAQKAEAYLKSTGIADISYWGPEAEFYIFDDVRYDQIGPGRLLLHRLRRGRLEHGTPGGPEPGLQAAAQGRLLPLPAGRPVPGPALRDDPDAGEGGRADRGPSPRGRHRRPGRDRHEVRPADQDGRQPDVLQVHHPQRRAQARQGRDLHAQADLRRQRLGHALPPEPLEGRDEPVLGREGLRPDQRDWPATTSAACSSTLRPCWPSAPRPPTRTAGWCPATRLRSTWFTPSATARRPCGSRSTPRARSRSGSSSAARTRPATPTSAFAAMLMAGLDGVQNKIDPGDPIDKDLYDLEPEEAEKVKSTPGLAGRGARRPGEATTNSCSRATCSPRTLIETWITYKRERELAPVNLRPVPYEFFLYFDL